MRDPHVVALIYRFVAERVVKYENPPPLEWETDAFHLRLEADKSRVEMKEHYGSAQEARDRVGPFLRTWEIRAALRRGHPEMHFEFEAPEVIDRNPPGPGEPQVIRPEGIASAMAVGNPTVTVTEATYPEPPKDFVLCSDADILWLRYERCRKDQEPLPSTAQVCLNQLQWSAGGRKQAAVKYGIDFDVLQKVGELANERGDRLTARKPGVRPFTPAESKWLEAAIRRIILRVGEVAANPNAPRPSLTMAHLPKL